MDVEAVEAVSEILGRVAAGTAVRPTRLTRDPDDELAVQPDPTAPYLVTAHVPADGSEPDTIERVERALWHLQAFGLRRVGQLQVRTVSDDWTDAWRDHYVQQRIGRLLIVPSWVDAQPAADAVVVRMDPGMAFGTGLHPTTRGCLLLLQALAPMPARVLDVGCGSGILSLAALRLGAQTAVAIDTDVLAVEATRANATLNGCDDHVKARHGSLPEDAEERFPLVLANLVAALLIDLAPRLAAHTATGGLLIASGIVSQRGDEVRAALGAAGYTVERAIDDGDWLSLQLRRTDST